MSENRIQFPPEYVYHDCDYCDKRFKCYGLVGGQAVCNRCYKKRFCPGCKFFNSFKYTRPNCINCSEEIYKPYIYPTTGVSV